ncbi:histidine kinase [bacterium]|nr:histidine kinase [bacterium]
MRLNPRVMRWMLAFLFWTAVGLFFSTQIYLLINVVEGRIFPFTKAMRSTLPDWYLWAFLAIPIIKLSKRYPLDAKTWREAIWIHLPASAAFATFHVVLAVTVLMLFEALDGNHPSWFEKFEFNFIWYFHYDVLIYWATVGFAHAVQYYRSFQEKRVTAVKLQAQLSQAQLQALKMQLHPHFLFNTLNSISSLLQRSGSEHADIQTAKKMIVRLADFLRLTLQNSGTQDVDLQQELEFLRCYLEIEKVRFQDRLTVRMNIDPATLNLRIPNLILQPIVENAIRYGIASRSSPGTVEITTARKNGMLQVRIRNDGPGLPDAFQEGVGLSNTKKRLEQSFGESYRFVLENVLEGGVEAILEIPVHE